MSSNGDLPNSTTDALIIDTRFESSEKRKGDAIWNRHWSIETREKDWKEMRKQILKWLLTTKDKKGLYFIPELRGRDKLTVPPGHYHESANCFECPKNPY